MSRTTTHAPRMIVRVNRALRAAGIPVRVYANSRCGYYYLMSTDEEHRDLPSIYVYRLDDLTTAQALAAVNESLAHAGLPALHAL